MANPHAIPIDLSASDRAQLQGWVRRRKTGQALATRARIVLACAEPGSTNGGVAGGLGVSRPPVGSWRRRFARRGLGGLFGGEWERVGVGNRVGFCCCRYP